MKLANAIPRAACMVAVTYLLAGATTADAADIWFDLDGDGDPHTTETEVTAAVGDIIEGYMVIGDYPGSEEYAHLLAMEYGLAVSDGLEVLGYQVMVDRAAVINDGLEGFAVVFGDGRTGLHEFPVNATRIVVRVLDEAPQSIELTVAHAWDRDVVNFVVGDGSSDGSFVVLTAEARELQEIGRINSPTPVEESTWGAIKKLFGDSAL